MSLRSEKKPQYTIPLPAKLLNYLQDKTARKVLDVGCGYGRACFFLQENGCKTIGVDVDKAQVKRALQETKKRNIRIETSFLINDACNLCFPNSFFDAITLLGTLTLVSKSERQKIVYEAWRVLKPSGYLFVEEFGRTWKNPVYTKRYREDFKITKEKGTFTLKDKKGKILHFAHHFSRKELHTLLKRFHIVSFKEDTFTSYYHGNWVGGFIILAEKTE